MVPLVIPFVPIVMPMVPLALPMVQLVPLVSTIGTPVVPLATNGTVGKITNGNIGKTPNGAIVNKVCYLGVVFTSGGSSFETQKTLSGQATLRQCHHYIRLNFLINKCLQF